MGPRFLAGLIGLFAALLLQAAAAAGQQPGKRTVAAVVSTVRAYAGVLGCNVGVDPRNVVSHRIEDRDVFVAPYFVDHGCTGGSNQTVWAVAVLQRSRIDDPKYYIWPEYSPPKQAALAREIDRLYVSDGRLMYEGRDYDFSKDGFCCPSVKVEAEILFRDGRWTDGRKH